MMHPSTARCSSRRPCMRSWRCFYADPPPVTRSPKGGRPRRHGAKFAFADPATWPTPTATLACQDDQYGAVTVAAWGGLHPKQQCHPGHGTRGPRPIVAGPSSASSSSGFPPGRGRPRCCGCGGPAPTVWISTLRGGPMPAGSTWSTPSGSVSRPLAGRPHGRASPPRPTAGPGWCRPATPSCAWPARSSRTRGCPGSSPDPSRQEASREGSQAREGRLTGRCQHRPAADEVSGTQRTHRARSQAQVLTCDCRLPWIGR
jgi:hypothetical protein